MANFHCAFQMIARQGGKSCVAALAYRSATNLLDQRTGEFWDYTRKGNVRHVDILTPDDAPKWVSDIAQECRSDRQSAFQQYSDIIEAAEKRKDSQVYRECEFSLPNELTEEQNIEWATAFVKDVFIKRGMVAVVNFHFDIDPETGMEKPHCHVLLSTRHLTQEGWRLKNRDWNSKDLVREAREQCSQYQNEALKKHGFDVQVTHLSYEGREIDIDAQPKLGANIFNMTRKGIETNTQKIFDAVRLKNQFKIVKDPEIVFEIVTSQHATFTRKDVAKVLNRYIDDVDQFQILLHRLMASKELVALQPKALEPKVLDPEALESTEEGKEEGTQKTTGGTKEGGKKETQGEANRQEKEQVQEGEKPEQQFPQTREPVYTTKKMVRVELNLIKTAEAMALRKTHPVSGRVINAVIAKYHKKFAQQEGLSGDQEKAIRHMLSPEQISCVVGFAGAGKTTCLEAVREAFEEEGYAVLGLAPTGRAAQSIGSCGICSMTVHRFLKSQTQGRERISKKTVVIMDEAGMLDSRRFSELETIVEKAGAKMIPMGDNNQAQAVEAGAPFRLITDRIEPAVLETVVRQQVDWQREAGRLFGTSQPRKALKMYQENGCFHGIEEEKPNLADSTKTIDNYCLARQISGHIWKEMEEDVKTEDMHVEDTRVESNLPYFDAISQHQDYALHSYWKTLRYHFIQNIICDFGSHKAGLEARGININAFEKLVLAYKAAGSETNAGENREILFEWIENALRKMSYNTIIDTNVKARQALVEAWAVDRKLFPDESHLMLAFTKENAHKLNEAARTFMQEEGVITGHEVTYQTQSIEEDDFGVEHKVGYQRTFAKGDRILFTRNNKGLGVNNGTLGTIVFLRHGKIKVLLDSNGAGEEQKKVSFAPKLYPFFDNGWATTIRKSQSVTADHVKFLGTWEDYRNLAYVAMTRHRRTLHLFYSDLDFWRPEKVIDRLSRIREKLLGVDYLDAKKLQGHLKEDTDVLWHHRHHKKAEETIQQGKDFWAAIKVTAKDVLETIFPPEEKKLKEEEAFLSLEDSEEYRSRDFFKDLEAKEGEGRLPGEDRLPDEAYDAFSIFNANSVSGSASDIAQPNPASPKKSQNAPKTDFLDEGYLNLEDTEEKRSSDIFKDPVDSQGKEAFSEEGVEKRKGNAGRDIKEDNTKEDMKREMQSRKGHQEEHRPSFSTQISPTSSSSDNGFKEKIEAIKEKISRDYDVETLVKEKPLSFEEAESQLKERIVELAISILGEPDKGSRNTPFLRFGKSGKFAVGVRGEKQGTYINFTTWVKGGAIRLIEDQKGLSAKEALAWAREWLGGSQVVVENHIVAKPLDEQERTEATWKPIVPVPNEVEDPDITNNKYLNYMLKDGNREISRHAYRDENGNLKGYVVRIEKPPVMQLDGTTKSAKLTPPLSYGEDARGFKYWKWKAFFGENDKTPYGMEKLRHDHSKPILIVEGEKTADAAQKALPEYNVLTWIGGAGSVDKTDWSCLIGKDVTIWPDYDYNRTGQEAAHKLQGIIRELNKIAGREGTVSIVTLSENLRYEPEPMKDGWDLADPLPKGWRVDTVAGPIEKARDDATQDHVVRGNDHKGGSTAQEEKRDNGEEKSQDKHTVRMTKKRDVSSPTEPETKLSRQEPSQTSASEVSAKPPQPKDPLTMKRERFEKARLPINQGFCANLGFLVQHKRLPRTAKELDAAYWQGERLTAIEGRLYKETLKGKDKTIDEKALTTRARAELAQNQTAPRHVTVFGKASDLDKAQLKQLQQHALLHQDRTNQSPTSSDLESICQVIKAHGRMMGIEGGVNEEHAASSTQTLNQTLNQEPNQTPTTQQERSKTPEPSSSSGIYQSLIEQQSLLTHIKDGSAETINRGGKMVLKDEAVSTLLKTQKIQDSCSERLCRMNSEIQSLKDYSQEMKSLASRRQKQRGFEM